MSAVDAGLHPADALGGVEQEVEPELLAAGVELEVADEAGDVLVPVEPALELAALDVGWGPKETVLVPLPPATLVPLPEPVSPFEFTQ